MPTLDSPTSVLGNSPRVNPRRRTKRMTLTVPVEVSGKDVENSSFSVATTATNLDRNGATLHLNRDLPVNSLLVVKNSRGTRTSARVIAQTRLAETKFAYGAEFLEDNNAQDFWGINFPISQVRR
jgi:PilZ domain-containing protein